jgi:purine-cytosine permease-like protein
VGDYGRYIPQNASPRVVGAYGFFGIFLGCWLAMIAAAFAATAFAPQAFNFVQGITTASPSVFLLPMLLVLGLASNIASAAMSLYNAALDIGSWPFFYRVQRWHIAVGLSAVVLGLTYLFVVATSFVTNVESFVTIMIVTATPWMVITGIHYLMNKGRYAPLDLHAFAIPGARGRYWYQGGVNPVALVAWACGVALGLLFSTTTLFTGPLEGSVQGVDLSWLMAAVGGGIVYLIGTLVTSGRRAGASQIDLADLATQEVSGTT